MVNENCPLRGHCDFEAGFCGYINDRTGFDQLDWTRDSAAGSQNNLGPQFDNTLGRLTLHFISML